METKKGKGRKSVQNKTFQYQAKPIDSVLTMASGGNAIPKSSFSVEDAHVPARIEAKRSEEEEKSEDEPEEEEEAPVNKNKQEASQRDKGSRKGAKREERKPTFVNGVHYNMDGAIFALRCQVLPVEGFRDAAEYNQFIDVNYGLSRTQPLDRTVEIAQTGDLVGGNLRLKAAVAVPGDVPNIHQVQVNSPFTLAPRPVVPVRNNVVLNQGLNLF